MKLRCLLLIVVFAAMSNFAQSQDCAKCTPRAIRNYDLDIYLNAPSDRNNAAWQQLLSINDAYIVSLMDTANPTCFLFSPERISSVMQEGEQPSDKKYTLPRSSPDVSGNFDYITFGTLTGTEGDYKATLKLVTAHSREIVAEASTSFSKTSEAKSAGHNLALKLRESAEGTRPLKEIIYDWEKKKREENNKIALNAKVEWVDLPATIEVGVPTPLKIKLVDCDDYKLKNRKMQIHTNSGVVQPEEPVTDENGTAKVVFIAQKEGEISLRVEYHFDYPSEKIGSTADIYSIKPGKMILTVTAVVTASAHRKSEGPGSMRLDDAFTATLLETVEYSIASDTGKGNIWLKMLSHKNTIDVKGGGSAVISAEEVGDNISRWTYSMDPEVNAPQAAIALINAGPPYQAIISLKDFFNGAKWRAKGTDRHFARFNGDVPVFETVPLDMSPTYASTSDKMIFHSPDDEGSGETALANKLHTTYPQQNKDGSFYLSKSVTHSFHKKDDQGIEMDGKAEVTFSILCGPYKPKRSKYSK
jgi:hypothetical protein